MLKSELKNLQNLILRTVKNCSTYLSACLTRSSEGELRAPLSSTTRKICNPQSLYNVYCKLMRPRVGGFFHWETSKVGFFGGLVICYNVTINKPIPYLVHFNFYAVYITHIFVSLWTQFFFGIEWIFTHFSVHLRVPFFSPKIYLNRVSLSILFSEMKKV